MFSLFGKLSTMVHSSLCGLSSHCACSKCCVAPLGFLLSLPERVQVVIASPPVASMHAALFAASNPPSPSPLIDRALSRAHPQQRRPKDYKSDPGPTGPSSPKSRPTITSAKPDVKAHRGVKSPLPAGVAASLGPKRVAPGPRKGSLSPPRTPGTPETPETRGGAAAESDSGSGAGAERSRVLAAITEDVRAKYAPGPILGRGGYVLKRATLI